MEETPTPQLDSTVERAEKNLQRLLDWIGRFDTRSSIIVGICVAMLGIISAAVPAFAKWTSGFELVLGLTLLLLLGALAALGFGQFPRTRSPNSSLFFFGTIAEMRLDDYQRRFHSMADDEYVSDLLSQAHANAIIIRLKFRALRWALALLFLSLIPWVMTIYLAKSIS